mgnify:CR=1 FL=1
MAGADGPPPSAAGGSGLARLDAADQRLSRRVAVDWPHPRWLTLPLGAVSRTANYGVLWYAVALLPWFAGARRPLATLLYVGVAVTAVEWLGYAVKHVVGRRRPSVADPTQPNHIPLPVSTSFPSSHASMSVAATWTLGTLYPAWLPALLTATAVLSFSRVYLGVHYLGDVVAGLGFGLAAGALYVWIVPAPL